MCSNRTDDGNLAASIGRVGAQHAILPGHGPVAVGKTPHPRRGGMGCWDGMEAEVSSLFDIES